MKARHLLVVGLFGGVLCNGTEFVFPLAVAMGNDFRYAQQYQRDDARPEIEITPPVGACNRIPAWNDTHDELAPVVMTAAISFLVGFRIAAWMGKRQIERLRRIWGK